MRPHRRADRRGHACRPCYRLKLFGIEPNVALLSHSNYGSHDNPSAAKMRKVCEILRARACRSWRSTARCKPIPRWDEALARSASSRNTTLSGRANLFVFPNLDAANIAYNMVRRDDRRRGDRPDPDGRVDKPAHILTPASTARRVVNMTAIAAVDAQIRAAQGEKRS